jgi:hypothetical protein
LNERLDEIDEPSPDDIAREVQQANDDAYHEAVSANLRQRLRRGTLIRAARERNIPLIEELTARAPELRSLAYRELAHRHGHDREQGEARRSDLGPVERVVLEDALVEFKRARAIMREHYSRWRGAAPAVLEVVADRRGVKLDRLQNFIKEHGSKISRAKSPI